MDRAHKGKFESLCPTDLSCTLLICCTPLDEGGPGETQWLFVQLPSFRTFRLPVSSNASCATSSQGETVVREILSGFVVYRLFASNGEEVRHPSLSDLPGSDVTLGPTWLQSGDAFALVANRSDLPLLVIWDREKVIEDLLPGEPLHLSSVGRSCDVLCRSHEDGMLALASWPNGTVRDISAALGEKQEDAWKLAFSQASNALIAAVGDVILCRQLAEPEWKPIGHVYIDSPLSMAPSGVHVAWWEPTYESLVLKSCSLRDVNVQCLAAHRSGSLSVAPLEPTWSFDSHWFLTCSYGQLDSITRIHIADIKTSHVYELFYSGVVHSLSFVTVPGAGEEVR